MAETETDGRSVDYTKLYDKRPLNELAPADAVMPDSVANLLYGKRAEKPFEPKMSGTDPKQIWEKQKPHALLSQIAGRDRELFSIAEMLEQDRAALRDLYLVEHASGLPEHLLLRVHDADVNDRLFHAQPHTQDEVDARAARLEAQWIERRQELDRHYGQDAEGLVARVSKFLETTPALAEILARDGVRYFPGVLDELVAYVHSSGFR